jgi:enoyl-CoA hydratase/carnithine racemase
MLARLDNPPRNFMTGAMVRELDQLARLIEDDATIGAVVITGAPEDVFITHFDVGEILAGADVGGGLPARLASGGLRAVGALRRAPGTDALLRRTPAAGLVGLRAIHDLFDRMNRQGTVFIAAINGLALGGGCELALACDIRIMSDRDLPIGQPEIALGLIPGGGGTQRLTRLLGSGRALELMLEGRALLPYEAVAAGLVHRVVEPEALLSDALATAERLARRSPTAVRELKRAVYEGASRPLDQGLHIERAGFLATASSPAAQRAMSLYVEDVEALGEVDPATALEALERWREGSAADMTEEG